MTIRLPTAHAHATTVYLDDSYHSPLIRKLSNIFKHTILRIALQSRSTLYNIFKSPKENINEYLASCIYSLKCNACDIVYVGWLVAILKPEFQNIRET